MTLPFDPACLPLLLGSLPHRSAALALELARRYTGALLTWPQLPQSSVFEHAVVQTAAGFPGLVIEPSGQAFVDRRLVGGELDRLALAYLESDISYGALVSDYASGLAELLRQGEQLRGVLALKGQALGPISLAAQLTDEQQRPLFYDAAFFDALVQHLRLRLMWQEAHLSEFVDATIICIDEPFLELVGLPFLPLDWDEVRARIEEAMNGLVGCKAIYGGGAPAWRELLHTSVDLIIADVYDHAPALLAAGPELAAFIERDGMVGLGIVPAEPDALQRASVDALLERIDALVDQLAGHGIPPERLLRHAVVTSSDGLAQLDLGAAERALQLLADLSARLRERHSFT